MNRKSVEDIDEVTAITAANFTALVFASRGITATITIPVMPPARQSRFITDVGTIKHNPPEHPGLSLPRRVVSIGKNA